MPSRSNLWDQMITDDMYPLFRQYHEQFGMWPDTYEDVEYAGLSKEDFVKVIKACLERNQHVPDIIDEVLEIGDYSKEERA